MQKLPFIHSIYFSGWFMNYNDNILQKKSKWKFLSTEEKKNFIFNENEMRYSELSITVWWIFNGIPIYLGKYMGFSVNLLWMDSSEYA